MKSTPCYLPDLTHCLCIELYIIYEAALVLQNFILKHVVYPCKPKVTVNYTSWRKSSNSKVPKFELRNSTSCFISKRRHHLAVGTI